MATLTTKDGARLFYQDWGHGRPLDADIWDGQLAFLATHGYRA